MSGYYVDCPRCRGKGELGEMEWGGGWLGPTDCDDCDGRGVIPAPVPDRAGLREAIEKALAKSCGLNERKRVEWEPETYRHADAILAAIEPWLSPAGEVEGLLARAEGAG